MCKKIDSDSACPDCRQPASIPLRRCLGGATRAYPDGRSSGRSGIRLARPLDTIQAPRSVEAVPAARIERLTSDSVTGSRAAGRTDGATALPAWLTG
jgi:hypothetical protein